MTDKIRIGVIGAGWPGCRHIEAYQANKDSAELAALCDLNMERCAGVAKQYAIKRRYDSYEEMISKEKLDAVSVCTPNCTHAPISVAAMKMGCHVICEKPMASSTAGAKEMIAAEKNTGKVLMIGHQRRFTGEVQYLKKLVDCGELGEIYFARAYWIRRYGIPGLGSWFTRKKMSGGGAMIDIGVHALDLALWMMGYPEPTGVSGSWGSRFGVHGIGGKLAATGEKIFDVDDYAVGHVRFGGGRSLVVQATWVTHVEKDEMGVELWGTKGGAIFSPLRLFSSDNRVHRNITPKLPESTEKYPEFRKEIAEFLDCIGTGKKPVCSSDEGLKTVSIIEQIYTNGESTYQ